jgi:hypothetical protein
MDAMNLLDISSEKSDAESKEHEALKKEIEFNGRLYWEMYKASELRRLSFALTLVNPMIALLISFLLLSVDSVRFFLYDLYERLGPDYSAWSFLLFVCSFVFFLSWVWVFAKSEKYRGYKNSYIKSEADIEQMSLTLPDIRLKYLRQRYLIISGKALKTDWIDDNRRRTSEYLQSEINSNLTLLEKQGPDDYPLEFDWDLVLIDLNHWKDLLEDEEIERKQSRNWKFLSIGIAVTYLILILVAIPIYDKAINIFGVPFEIVIWSALGSFAAILHRFYKSPTRINFETEFRWLIARPIIGIVMGALAYLALISGALIFNVTSATTSGVDIEKLGEQWQYWIIAFLAGFSDKFYEKVIEWLTSKFSPEGEDDVENDGKRGETVSKKSDENALSEETKGDQNNEEVNEETS